jgi:hypothetical protein
MGRYFENNLLLRFLFLAFIFILFFFGAMGTGFSWKPSIIIAFFMTSLFVLFIKAFQKKI